MNQSCVKKDKNVFKHPFRFHAFPEITEILETGTQKIRFSTLPRY